jgi:hypothetical protein
MGRKPPPIKADAMLGLFRRADGAIYLGLYGKNAEHEHEPGLTPVAAFAFSTAEAATEARDGALVRLAKHVRPDGLIGAQSIGQVVAAIRAEASALGLDARFIRVTVAPPEPPVDWAETPMARAFGAIMFLIAVCLIIAAAWHG